LENYLLQSLRICGKLESGVSARTVASQGIVNEKHGMTGLALGTEPVPGRKEAVPAIFQEV